MQIENHSVWVERVAGAACFTKDYGRKSYYIQIFDMQYHQQVTHGYMSCTVTTCPTTRCGSRRCTWRWSTRHHRHGSIILRPSIAWQDSALQMKGRNNFLLIISYYTPVYLIHRVTHRIVQFILTTMMERNIEYKIA